MVSVQFLIITQKCGYVTEDNKIKYPWKQFFKAVRCIVCKFLSEFLQQREKLTKNNKAFCNQKITDYPKWFLFISI